MHPVPGMYTRTRNGPGSLGLVFLISSSFSPAFIFSHHFSCSDAIIVTIFFSSRYIRPAAAPGVSFPPVPFAFSCCIPFQTNTFALPGRNKIFPLPAPRTLYMPLVVSLALTMHFPRLLVTPVSILPVMTFPFPSFIWLLPHLQVNVPPGFLVKHWFYAYNVVLREPLLKELFSCIW